jgi:pyrimidine operon attenuation protein/uracil phosphoribosyltransferase
MMVPSSFRIWLAFTEIIKTSILLDKQRLNRSSMDSYLTGLFERIARRVIVEREMPVEELKLMRVYRAGVQLTKTLASTVPCESCAKNLDNRIEIRLFRNHFRMSLTA